MKFVCGQCHYEKEIPPKSRELYAGRVVNCPKCKAKTRVGEITDQPRKSTKTCPYCAESIAFAAAKCKHCGEFLDGSSAISRATRGKKLILPAMLLLIFFNFLGLHAFYTGRIGQGIFYLVGSLVSGILIFLLGNGGVLVILPAVIMLILCVCLLGDLLRLLTGSYKDGDGNKMTDWL